MLEPEFMDSPYAETEYSCGYLSLIVRTTKTLFYSLNTALRVNNGKGIVTDSEWK